MSQEEYWFWLCNINNLNRLGIKKLMEVFHEPKEIYKASEDEIIRSGAVDVDTARAIHEAKSGMRCVGKLEKLKKDGISFIHFGSSEYPEAFEMLEDMPYSFYVKGKMPDPTLISVGIVGSRTCSGYGKEMTIRYAQALAANNVQIISGMALGVDSYAARGAIESGGKTFAVLGSGLDVIYPKENIELYYQIIMTGGGIISEYPFGTQPLGWHFPHRNRLISALSNKLLVMEARNRSGTSTTASYALELGKDVYALPGRVTDPLSEGCNRLISEGAGMLISPEEFLTEIFGGKGKIKSSQYDRFQADILKNLDRKKGLIYQNLSYEPLQIDVLAGICKIPASQLAIELTELEMMGLCRQISKDYYSKG